MASAPKERERPKSAILTSIQRRMKQLEEKAAQEAEKAGEEMVEEESLCKHHNNAQIWMNYSWNTCVWLCIKVDGENGSEISESDPFGNYFFFNDENMEVSWTAFTILCRLRS